MSGVFDDFDGKMRLVASYIDHSFHTAFVVTRFDKFVAALDTFVNTG